MTASPPRHATPRNPDRATFGPAAYKVGRAMGLDLDPWQRDFLDVALEVDERGRLVYREVRVSIGRQSGKTLMAFVAQVDRMLAGERRGWGHRQRILYAAQTGAMAREKMLDAWVPILGDSRIPFDERRDVTKSNGRESFRIGAAKCSVLYGGPTSGHGGTNDMAVIDEAFAHQDATLEVGARPTMLTRTHAQLWVLSAAGWTAETSPYWWDKLDDLRERSDADDWGTVCGLEYAAPDELERTDPEAWGLAVPALVSGRITEDVIRGELDSIGPAEFDRTILNRWGSKAAGLFPADRWAACADVTASPGVELHAAVDVAPGPDGGRAAAIVVAGWQGEHVVVEVVAHAPGTGWVRDRLDELIRRHRFRTVSADFTGPARAIEHDIRRAVPAKRLIVPATGDVTAAAQAIHQDVLDGAVRHLDDPRLNAAVLGAAKRIVGDGWAFRRRDSTADICPLVAASLAARMAKARRGAFVEML